MTLLIALLLGGIDRSEGPRGYIGRGVCVEKNEFYMEHENVLWIGDEHRQMCIVVSFEEWQRVKTGKAYSIFKSRGLLFKDNSIVVGRLVD